MFKQFEKELDKKVQLLKKDLDNKVKSLPQELYNSFVDFYNLKDVDPNGPKTNLKFTHGSDNYEVQLPGQFTKEQLREVLYYLKIKL